jgi:outer membrane murein-binding lipoprotein Lpp
MNKFYALLLLSSITLTGCQNFSPRMNPEIQNQNGKIDEIKNNQNGLIAEIGKIKQESEIANSKLDEVQNGLLNVNANLSKNENSGVQILQGDGALILIFSIFIVCSILYYYNKRLGTSEKANEILANEIKSMNNPVLKACVYRSAMNSKAEEKIYKLFH